MKYSIYLIIFLSFFKLTHAQAQPEADATYKDIQQTLGMVPTFMKNFPASGIAGAWEEMKGTQLNPKSAIPGKYKELITLAVAAQIPCRYCSYFHTQASKLYQASQQERSEAIALAGIAQRFGTYLSGTQTDLNEFKGEVDKMLMFTIKAQGRQAMEEKPKGPVAIKNLDDAYKDVSATFGFVPNFIKQYPGNSFVGLWKEIKGTEFNPDSAIPGKYKDLIGLAVGAQIPCSYCVYFHTQSALMQGATKEELNEAAALAGTVRLWSTVLNGHMMSESTFKKEVDQIMKHVRSKMPKEVSFR